MCDSYGQWRYYRAISPAGFILEEGIADGALKP